MFSCKLCKIFKNTFFTEHLRATASVFEKGSLRSSPYAVRTRENTNQKNSKNGHFSRSRPIIDVWLGSEYVPVMLHENLNLVIFHLSFTKASTNVAIMT